MSKIRAETIKEIKKLADESTDDQLKACKECLQQHIFPKLKKSVDESIILELLPIFYKFMESDNHEIQNDGVFFIWCITSTPDKKTNTKLVIDAGAIPKLENLLSSTNTDVLISVLRALINIAYFFPEEVVQNDLLQSIIHCLQSETNELSSQAAWFLENISHGSEQRIVAVFEAGCVVPLIKILESKHNSVCEEALTALTSIISFNAEYCQRVLDFGALKSLKKLCDRLFSIRVELDKTVTRDKKKARVLFLKFLKCITSYGNAAHIDMIINERFVPKLLQQIKGKMASEIKKESIKVIENIISVKREFLPVLGKDNIISLLYNNLRSINADFLISTLTAMRNIIEFFEVKNIIRQKIIECRSPTRLKKLCNNENEEIKHLSTMIYEFAYEPVLTMRNNENLEQIEIDSGDENTPVNEAPYINRQRKRPFNAPTDGRSNKRRMSSVNAYEHEDVENSDISVDDNDNDCYHDFDDLSGRQSLIGDEDADYTSRDDLISRNDLPPNTFPLRGSSFNSRNVLLSTLTNRETFQNEVKHLPKSELSEQLTPPLPLIAPALLEAASPYNEINPYNNVGSQLSIDTETAATADETAQNKMKSSPFIDYDNESRPISNSTHTLPEAAPVTNEETILNNYVDHHSHVDAFDEFDRNQIVLTLNSGKRSPSADFDHPVSTPVSDLISEILRETNNGRIPNRITPRQSTPVHQPATAHTIVAHVAPSVPNDMTQNEIIEYWRPFEKTINEYCETLVIQFNRKDYSKFMSKIEIHQITTNSKPGAVFETNDQTGFGCLSILLTGNEDASSKVRMKINQKFIDDLNESGNFDEEKITKVIAPPYLMKEEHLQTIATWLKCRILVYCNGWKKYGNWEEENPMIPLFVLEKNENGYQIILDLKNDV